MGLVANLKNFLNIRTKAAGFLSRSDFGLVSRLFGQEWGELKYLEAYGKSLYVYACVSKIAEKIGSIDFKLNKIINKEGDTEEVLSHEILDLLYMANPFYTKAEFLETDVINRKLTGDSFILKIRNTAGQIAELWNIRPDLVTIHPDPENYIGYYEILTAQGKRKRVETTEMIHIKYPSPLNTLLGMSPLSSAKVRVDIEKYASEFQRDFFLNNARPDAMIELEGGLTEVQRQELKEGWEKRHKGVGKSSKIGVLFGGAKYHQVSLTQKEMDYIESMKFTRDDILVAFKVPKPIVAITDDVNRANAETAQEIFLNETIIPEVKRLVDKLNEQLIRPDFGEEYFVSFADPVPVNREMRLNEFDKGIDRWITINEARREMKLEVIPGGDVLFRPMMVQPVATIGEKPEEKNYRNLHGKRVLKYKFQLREELQTKIKEIQMKVKEKVKEKIDILKKGIKDNSLFKDVGRRRQYWDYRMKDIDVKSKRMRSLVITIKNQQKEKFIDKFKKVNPKTKSDIRKLFNRKEANREFKKAILPLMLSIFKEAGEDAMSLLRLDKPFDIEKKVGPTILGLLEKRAAFFASSVNETTLLGLAETLAIGIEAGESIKDLENRITDEYDNFQKYRAGMIARTETNAVVNEAHLEAYDQSEVVEGKEWVATLDDRTRDEHLMMDGEIVGKDAPFSNGLDYPSEPNCRCTVAPVVNLI
ncbi:MAG: phage portal protein [Candidatus Nealsonbacteria bacterium]